MEPGDIAQMDYLRKLADRLRSAGHGQQGKLIAEAVQWLGVSKPTVYARLHSVGWRSGRKLRSDKGDSRLPAEEVKQLAAIIHASQRKTGKVLLATQDAIDIALSNGYINQPVAPATALRLMRKHDCHPRQMARPEPHANLRSNHPNHVWQLDASVCVLYYLRNGQAQVMDERKFNVRKPRELAKVSNQRLLRYAATDHATGNAICRYYNVSGEDQRTLFDFLMWAFHKQPGRVMHGVPNMLVWDAGSANESHAIKALLTALMIRHWAHIPGNPYRAPSIFVLGEADDGSTRYWECDPIATDHLGFLVTAAEIGAEYKAKPDMATDTARKDVNELAYGARETLDAAAAKTKGRLAFDGAIDPFADLREKADNLPAHMTRRGTAMDLPNPVQVEMRPLSFIDVLNEIRAHLPRPIAPDENTWLRERHAAGLTEQDIPQVIEQLLRGDLRTAVTTAPRLRAVS